VREEVIDALGPQEVAQAFSELDSDDALDVLEDLDEEAKQRILASVPIEERVILEQGLTYPEESAGRLMQRKLVAVPSFWTVGETIDFLRAAADLPDDFLRPLHRRPRPQADRGGAALAGHADEAAGEADGDHGDRPAHHPRRDGPGGGGLHVPPVRPGLGAGGGQRTAVSWA